MIGLEGAPDFPPFAESPMNVQPTQDHHAKRQLRIEDRALITGEGRFIDDAAVPGQAYAVFVRSPYACARVRSIDIKAARSAPGVVVVLTGKDMEAGVGNMCRHPEQGGRDGAKLVRPFRPVLAADRVLHVGKSVAMVVGETREAAMDAAELIAVEYEELPAIIDIEAATASGAPQLWPDAPRNSALEWLMPHEEAKLGEVQKLMAAADHVARVKVVNQRLIVASMETRGATASYDAGKDAYTLRACSQGANAVRDQIAAIMGLKAEQLRVFSEDVGGAFGMKTPAYPEYLRSLLLAQTGRAVHWMSTRSESFMSDNQARDTVTEAALALDKNGKFLALHVRHIANMGAYMTSHGAHIQTNNFARCFPTMYDIREGRRRSKLRVHQHGADRAVPWRRPTRGELPDGARGRRGGAGQRHRWRAAAAAQSDQAKSDAVQDACRHHLRQRRFCADPGSSAGACRLHRLSEAAPRGDEARPSTRPRALLFPRALRRRANRRRLDHLYRQGLAATRPRPACDRTGACVHLQPHRGRPPADHARADRVRQGDTALGVAGYASVASRGTMTVGHAVVHVIDLVLEKGKRPRPRCWRRQKMTSPIATARFEVVGTDRRLSLFEVAARGQG